MTETNDEKVTEILAERGSRYGRYASIAVLNNRMNKLLRDEMDVNPLWRVTEEQECLIIEGFNMILNKMARVVQGDPLYMDNLDDIVGYARLVQTGIKDSLGDKT